MVTVKISTRGAKRIRLGHLWVYRSDIRNTDEAEAAAIVRVVDDARNFVGQAFYSDRSQIALRFLTTRDEVIDRAWWRDRLQACAERRASIANQTNAYRLVYSEGDLMSSLIVDVYDGHYVLQTLSQGTDRIQNQLLELLVDEFHPQSIVELNDARVRQLEGLELRSGALHGDDPHEIEVVQHGVRFMVSPRASQKTGAFLDQRENYLAARQVAHGRALDCFTFTGGFALHLAESCDNVIGIDISSDAVAAAERNAKLNNAQNVTFRVANVFDALREMETAGERFDTIILDPPAFT
ncbi:MAG TPA: class I SAM-dependent methyltransferase, partial [Pyrinomonadaceae bacterium]|nr:class I SAM-dependent methyltransferase [Pyrinomonadaceae bacterium]